MTDTAKPTKKRIEVVELIGAQALDVYDETGLTPRQLVEQRDECVALLRAALTTIDESEHWWVDCADRGGFDADGIRAIIAKVEQK